MRGAGPCSSSQFAGLAMNSPWASRPTISSTVTDGRSPGAWYAWGGPAIRPSSAMSFSSSFRRDAVAALDAEGARDLALAGFAGAVGEEGEDLLAWREACPRLACACGHASLSLHCAAQPAVSSTASLLAVFGFACGGFLPPSSWPALGRSRGDQLDRLLHASPLPAPGPWAGGVDLAVVHIGSVAAVTDLHLPPSRDARRAP